VNPAGKVQRVDGDGPRAFSRSPKLPLIAGKVIGNAYCTGGAWPARPVARGPGAAETGNPLPVVNPFTGTGALAYGPDAAARFVMTNRAKADGI
jgi:hypothetical protein